MAGILTTPTPVDSGPESPLSIPTGHRWARRMALLIAGVLILMLIAWVLDDPVENLSTDWTAFDKAADRVLAGDDVYRPYDAESEPLPYLYPPFALVLALPLGALGFAGSFIFSALLSLCSLVLGLVWMGRANEQADDPANHPTGAVDRATALIVGLASGATISSTLIGQYSGIYALAVGGAARAYTTDRQVLSGAFLALLWLKPNLAVAVPVVLLWSRSWDVLRGFSMASLLVFAASLPFGVHRWEGFFSNVQMMAELQETGVVPFRKMVTVLGSAQTVFDVESTEPALIVFWLTTTALLGIAVLVLWRRSALAESPVRAFGAFALFIVAANPRLYFYDSTLVVVGVLGVWIATNSVGGGLAKRLVPGLAALAWLSLWGGLFVPLNIFVGPLAGLTLLVSAADQGFSRNSRANRPPRTVRVAYEGSAKPRRSSLYNTGSTSGPDTRRNLT